MKQEKPNIIFIILDTLRADVFHEKFINGNSNSFLKNILEHSLIFENCIANSPWTVPSHISMFTGLYSTQNSLLSEDIDKCNKKSPILAEILKDLGYDTLCFTENAFISNSFGLARGFDHVFNVWDWNPWNKTKYPLSQIIVLLEKVNSVIKKIIKNKKIFKFWVHSKNFLEKIIKILVKRIFFQEILFGLKNDTIVELEKFSLEVKEMRKDKPGFLFFNFLTTHDPYIPLVEKFKDFNISMKDFKIIKKMLIFPLKTRIEINLKSKKLTSNEIRVIKKLYDACVFSADVIVKKTFSILRELKLLEDSYIIITSDHGEHLGGKLDHYLWEHNTYQSIYEPLMKVPLLIYNKEFKKRIIKEQVQLKDLFHTIINLTGLPYSYITLKKSILNQIETNTTPEYIFGEYPNPKKVMHHLIDSHRRTITKSLIPKIFNDLYFVRSNSYKYIKYDNLPIEEFYDLLNDPNEQNNIFDTNNDEYTRMKLFLENQLKLIKDPEIIKDLITKKEKELVKKIISGFKIQNI
jgi:arylsulfatase A-like enzyme